MAVAISANLNVDGTPGEGGGQSKREVLESHTKRMSERWQILLRPLTVHRRPEHGVREPECSSTHLQDLLTVYLHPADAYLQPQVHLRVQRSFQHGASGNR